MAVAVAVVLPEASHAYEGQGMRIAIAIAIVTFYPAARGCRSSCPPNRFLNEDDERRWRTERAPLEKRGLCMSAVRGTHAQSTAGAGGNRGHGGVEQQATTRGAVRSSPATTESERVDGGPAGRHERQDVLVL